MLSVSVSPGEVHDVLITEIMADPDPPVLLPNMEYIELVNRSRGTLNLEKWTLQIGKEKITFPALSFPADSFLLICPSGGCSHFPGVRLCIDRLPGNSLNNGGEYVGLKNRRNDLIHWINYDRSFYHDELKNTGGWSLEMIDTDNPCAGKENWKASTDYRGGSPLQKNPVSGTINESGSFQYVHLFLPADSVLRIWFSKPVGTGAISNSWFILEPGKETPVKVNPDSVRHQYLDLFYRHSFKANTLYSLQLNPGITDCSGNQLHEITAVSFMKPVKPLAGDIIINEILFDALPGKQEFVEFYNSSDKYISSSDLILAYHGPSDTYKSTFSFSDDPFLITPRSFAVLARDAEEMDQYRTADVKTIHVNTDLPSLHDGEGCIRLMNRSMEVLEQFCYSDKMHYSGLGNKSGVSLERVRFRTATGDPGNWHSAASTTGYATPGENNSQFLEEPDPEKEITLEYEIFSPDNDGYKDIETIGYKLDKPGFAASILVFDARGRKVRTLANNQTLGTTGSFTWDGMDDAGHLASTGVYLVYIEMHHPSGEVRRYKKTCVVGGGKR